MKSINVKNETKTRFDEALAVQIGIRKRKLSADDFVNELLDLWEEKK